MRKFVAAMVPVLFLAGCGENPREAAADRLEDQAEANAAVAGATPVALGLSEAQLLDADVLGPGNVELGDVTSLVRDASGAVSGLIVEIDNSEPDRFVQLPLAGLTIVRRGNDQDILTTMTKEQFAKLPDAVLPTR